MEKYVFIWSPDARRPPCATATPPLVASAPPLAYPLSSHYPLVLPVSKSCLVDTPHAHSRLTSNSTHLTRKQARTQESKKAPPHHNIPYASQSDKYLSPLPLHMQCIVLCTLQFIPGLTLATFLSSVHYHRTTPQHYATPRLFRLARLALYL
ncbi:hypothetical protein B0H10DRAFT_2022138, partial [Mycena sp. CBHHK59/15]